MVPEIWTQILNYILDVEDLCNCRLVSTDFKDLIERNDEIRSKIDKNVKNIKISFLHLFPRLKYLKVPTKISNIYLLKNLKTATFYIKQEDLTQYISSLEDLLFPFHNDNEKKIIKIYTEKCIYWLSQYKYGRYAEQDHDDIDDYLRDATRCKTLISNKKPFQYFPIRKFIYVCPIEKLSGFDYYPSASLRKYTWQPVRGNNTEIHYFQYLEYLADSVLDIDRNEKLETYEIPIFEWDLSHMENSLPNIKKFAILKADSIVYSNRIVYFSDLPDTETFIDNVFKF